jgi:hypothetical protein
MSLTWKRKGYHLSPLRQTTQGPRLVSAYVDLFLWKWKPRPRKRRTR